MTYGRVTLQKFDTEEPTSPPESADFRRGYEEGYAAAALEGENTVGQALASVSATLADMSFGYEEARLHLIRSIAPLFAQIAETVVPEILQATFTSHLTDILNSALDHACATPVQICVAPTLVDELNAAIPQETEHPFFFLDDASVKEGQAVIQTADAEILLDQAALSEALRQTLLSLNSFERSTANGG